MIVPPVRSFAVPLKPRAFQYLVIDYTYIDYTYIDYIYSGREHIHALKGENEQK